MSRRQLKSPRSLSGRYIHLTLVTEWSPSLSWMTSCHTLCAMSIGPPILRYNYFKIRPSKSMVKVICVVKGQGHIWPSTFKCQGHSQSQTHWSHLRPGVQSICLLFVSRQLDRFGWDIANFIFDLENSRSRSYPRSNLMVTFEAFNMFAFRFVAIRPFLAEI